GDIQICSQESHRARRPSTRLPAHGLYRFGRGSTWGGRVDDSLDVGILHQADVELALRPKSDSSRQVARPTETGSYRPRMQKNTDVQFRQGWKRNHPNSAPAKVARLPFGVVVYREVSARGAVLSPLANRAPKGARSAAHGPVRGAIELKLPRI